MLRILQITLLRIPPTSSVCGGVTKIKSNQIRFYSQPKNDLQNWIESLDEAQRKRIRFVQNEVKKIFKIEFIEKIAHFLHHEKYKKL